MRALGLGVAVLVASCAGVRPPGRAPGAPEPPLPPAPAEVRTYRPERRLVIRQPSDVPRGVGRLYREGNRWVWDGEGRWRLDGSRLRGDCSQAENQEALMTVWLPRFTLKGFRIYESKNGLVFKGDYARITDCVFEKICEDAINPKDCAHGVVERCEFAQAEDKVLQLNRCQEWEIRHNVFRQARNAVRAMGSSVRRAEGNRFYNVDTAYHATRRTGRIVVDATSDVYVNVRQRYKTDGRGTVWRVARPGSEARAPAP